MLEWQMYQTRGFGFTSVLSKTYQLRSFLSVKRSTSPFWQVLFAGTEGLEWASDQEDHEQRETVSSTEWFLLVIL